MENICSLAFNCFIITTIITNGDLPELRAKRGFYSLGSTCHHNKHSLEISPVLYFKVLHIQESYLCILSGWLLLYKAVSISQDEMRRAGGRTNANVGSPTRLLTAHAWREAGTLQGPEEWCCLCSRCLLDFIHPFQHRWASPPRTLLPPHIPSQEESLCKSVKGSGDTPISVEILLAEKTTKSPEILISIVKTKPLKKKPTKNPKNPSQ